MQITFDSQLRAGVYEDGAVPLVFIPTIDWENFTGANIIGKY